MSCGGGGGGSVCVISVTPPPPKVLHKHNAHPRLRQSLEDLVGGHEADASLARSLAGSGYNTAVSRATLGSAPWTQDAEDILTWKRGVNCSSAVAAVDSTCRMWGSSVAGVPPSSSTALHTSSTRPDGSLSNAGSTSSRKWYIAAMPTATRSDAPLSICSTGPRGRQPAFVDEPEISEAEKAGCGLCALDWKREERWRMVGHG